MLHKKNGFFGESLLLDTKFAQRYDLLDPDTIAATTLAATSNKFCHCTMSLTLTISTNFCDKIILQNLVLVKFDARRE